MPAAKTTKTTAPKAPQDRKPKAAAVETFAPEDTLGWELMKPMGEIPVWEQTPLVALMQTAFEDSSKEDGEESSFSIDLIGQLAKALIPYAVDEAAYVKFVSGAGAMERAMNLAMAWVGQMGESISSEA